MYHPTSRVLTVLELLQSRPSISGPELSARLEMDVRTVRRYITHLQDIGIPIEATIGRNGGYRLRPGFKLPPLMFTEEEATAIMLGLLSSTWLEIEQSLLIELSEAIHASQRVAIDYRSSHNESTHRKVEPYGMNGWRGHWYLVGYCCLRQDYRVFRLDHIQKAQILSETFKKDSDFDYEEFMREKYKSSTMQIEVEFQSDMFTVQQRISTLYGTLTPTATGVLLQEQYDDMDGMARYLMALNLPFIVHRPPELCEALLRLGERMVQIAAASGTAF